MIKIKRTRRLGRWVYFTVNDSELFLDHINLEVIRTCKDI